MENNHKTFNALLFAAAFVITIILVITGAYVQEGFLIEAGEVSPQRFKAPRKMENTVATERNRLAALDASAKIEPVMERDTTVDARVKEDIENFFQRVTIRRREFELNAMHINMAQETGEPTEETEPAETAKPTDAAEPVTDVIPSAGNSFIPEESIMPLPIHLNENMTRLIMEMTEPTYKTIQENVYGVLDQVFKDGLQDVEAKGLLTVRDHIDEIPTTSDLQNLCYEIIAAYIKPNIVVNIEATKLAKQERAEKYDIEYYKKDQLIVDENEIISEEAYAALEQLSLIKKDTSGNIFLIAGAITLVGCIFCMFYFYARTFLKKILHTKKETLLFFTLYVGTVFSTYVMIDLPYQIATNLIFVMLMAMLFDSRMSIIINLNVTIVCMLIYKGDMEYVVYYLFAGTFATFIINFTNERNKIITAGLLSVVTGLVTYLGVSFFFEKAYSPDMLTGAAIAGGMGIISVIVAFGSAPFWEAVFGVVTPFRLLDLASPNSPVLRRLTIEAPGTYHHSLIVANLAENAAYEIGVNPAIARTGGYYHDIGKLKYPQYFSENQAGVNPHDAMDPLSSVHVIMSHVSFGIELAKKHRLPPVIQDIIKQHHGTTLIKFFYAKAKTLSETKYQDGKSEAPDEVCEDDFRYHYIIPQTKEAAIVMLADTVEAAVRSIIPSGKTLGEVEQVMRKLIADKVEDGQLLDSGLTLRDIETIVEAFLLVFKGMNHDRIPYPEEKAKSAEMLPEGAV